MTSHRSYDGRTKIYIAKKKKKKKKNTKKIYERHWGEKTTEKVFFFLPSSDEGKCHPHWSVWVLCVCACSCVYGKKRPVRSLIGRRWGREREGHNSMRRHLYISLVTLLAPTGSSWSVSATTLRSSVLLLLLLLPTWTRRNSSSFLRQPLWQKKKKKKKKRDPSESHEKLSSSVLNCCY